jgi:hypothetical protein
MVLLCPLCAGLLSTPYGGIRGTIPIIFRPAFHQPQNPVESGKSKRRTPPPTAMLARGDCRPRAPRLPAGAPRNQAEHGAARLWLVLDRRRRMGEGRALGLLEGNYPWRVSMDGQGRETAYLPRYKMNSKALCQSEYLQMFEGSE